MARKATLEEKRESRISLLVKPSLYRDIVLLADSQGESLNAFIEKMLVRTAERNSDVIAKFLSARQEATANFVDAESPSE